MSQDKNKRQIEVYRAITKLKAGYIDDVMNIVAPLVGEDSDNTALKRAIRRDLNALVESHVLTIEYYTPSGELISPDEEDQHKNTRAKYCIPGAAEPPIRGKVSLEKNSYAVICKESLIPSLNFTDNFTQVPTDSICITFENGLGGYLHFWIDRNDLPLQIQFSRGIEYANEFESKKKVKEHLGRRSVLILCSNRSVSRYKISEFLPHIQINLGPQPEDLEVIKTNPDSPAQFAKKWDIKPYLGLLTQGDETREFPNINFKFSAIKDSVNLKLPSLIEVGQSMVLCHIKK